MKKIYYLIVSIAILYCSAILKAQSSYKITNKIKVEGDGGWDYLVSDEATGKLYISHGTVTQVVNEADGKLIGTIPDTKGVHGIALASDLNKGFISNGKDTSVTIFNIQTLAKIATIKVTGKNPDAILYDQFSHKVFVYNGRSDNATVTISISESIKTVTLTFTKSSGTDAIWLSDIKACINGTFPTSYYSPSAPESSQAEYFLVLDYQ